MLLQTEIQKIKVDFMPPAEMEYVVKKVTLLINRFESVKKDQSYKLCSGCHCKVDGDKSFAKCNSCGMKKRTSVTLCYIGKGGEGFSAVAIEDVILKVLSRIRKSLCDASIDEREDVLLELEQSLSITVQSNKILNIEINKEK